MEFGNIIEDYNPEHENVYNFFIDYFNNPILQKIRDNEKYSIYMSKTMCMLSTECRYIIVIVHKNEFPIGNRDELRNLKWVSFQTRTLQSQIDCGSHAYIPSKDGPLMDIINRTNENKTSCLYEAETIPVIITLLFTKRNDANVYQPKGTIIHALETYNTIVTFKTD